MSTMSDDRNDTPATTSTRTKAAYEKPTLVEFGSVQAITQGGGSVPADGGGMLRMAGTM